MPLVILLDNSLSMYKNVNEKISKKDLSHLVVKKIIDQISETDKYEYIALVSVSSTAEILVEFTREYTRICDSLLSIQPGDSFNLEPGLAKVNTLVTDSWGCFTNIHIVLITDGADNSSQENSIKKFYLKLKENKSVLKELYESIGVDFDSENYFKNSILNDDLLNSTTNFNFDKKFSNTIIPFSFPNRFDIICFNRNENTNFIRFGFDDENFKLKTIQVNDNQNSKLFFLNEILKLNSSIGKVHTVENLTKAYVENDFLPNVLTELFKPFDFELKCGQLKSIVNLVPSPINKSNQFYGYVGKELSGYIELISFINIPDFLTPQTVSRHLMIQKTDSEQKNSFLNLLHTSLKSENMAAIVKVGLDWYGAIVCGTDGKADKKKSYLTLAIFRPDFETMETILSKVTNETKTPASPVKGQIQRQSPTKSYAKGCIVWYRAVNLQSDVQKIFRNAKKMHEKLPIFYKELNRVRKAALTFGFYELFQGLSKMFERELTSSSSSYNAETTAQLAHVIRCLNSPEYKDYRKDIQPWITQAPYSKGPKK